MNLECELYLGIKIEETNQLLNSLMIDSINCLVKKSTFSDYYIMRVAIKKIFVPIQHILFLSFRKENFINNNKEIY